MVYSRTLEEWGPQFPFLQHRYHSKANLINFINDMHAIGIGSYDMFDVFALVGHLMV